MQILNYEEAHVFVDNNKNAKWDGWTIVLWKRNDIGFMKKNGKSRNGKWGFESRINCDLDGLWRVYNCKSVKAKV